MKTKNKIIQFYAAYFMKPNSAFLIRNKASIVPSSAGPKRPEVELALFLLFHVENKPN
jgi:hypothetical protein